MRCPYCGTLLNDPVKYCGKCGHQIDSSEQKAQRTHQSRQSSPERIKKSGGRYAAKPSPKQRNRTAVLIVGLFAAVIVLIGVFFFLFGAGRIAFFSNTDEKTESPLYTGQDIFYETNFNCIDVIEVHDVVMHGDSAGSVTITVQLPDYSKLFKAAYASNDPDQYVLGALQSGQYDICTYEITARVTMEDGQQVIHSDEAVRVLLEQELSDATMALVEAG